jgi:hypothetical protein
VIYPQPQQGTTPAAQGKHHRSGPDLDQAGKATAINHHPVNSATSELAVVDLTTGKTVGTVSGFDFATGVFGGECDRSTERSVQLIRRRGPAGRTHRAATRSSSSAADVSA